jgi:hypothetical protein
MLNSDATQASNSLNYQDDVNTDLDQEHDLDATALDDSTDDEKIQVSSDYVKGAIQKVYTVFVSYFLRTSHCVLISKNCTLSSFNSTASRELGQANSDF